jgi:hypothetical protein
MWAMWANILKNFVHGPSASVTFSRRPYPGAIKQTANGHAATDHRPYRTLQCSTLVGGNVSHAYIAYMVRAWGFGHAWVPKCRQVGLLTLFTF